MHGATKLTRDTLTTPQCTLNTKLGSNTQVRVGVLEGRSYPVQNASTAQLVPSPLGTLCAARGAELVVLDTSEADLRWEWLVITEVARDSGCRLRTQYAFPWKQG